MLELTYSNYGTEAVLERRGSWLHYWLRDTHSENAPLVVFLHGAGVDHRMWASQMDAFAAKYRVLTLDIRGHGQSRPAGDYAFGTIVDDGFALLDIVRADKAILVGLSMGGNVAQEMVFRSPDRVAALVCLGCTCNTLVPWLDRTAEPVYEALFGPMLALYPMKALLKRIGKIISLKPDGQRYIYEASALLTNKELTTVMKSLLATLHHEPDYKVTIPELLLHGSDDNLGNIRKIMPKWHARDPHSEFVIIPEASHCTNIDNPAFFNRTALDWLGRTLP